MIKAKLAKIFKNAEARQKDEIFELANPFSFEEDDKEIPEIFVKLNLINSLKTYHTCKTEQFQNSRNSECLHF